MNLDELRAQYREARCHHVVVPDVLATAAAARVRDEVDAAGFVCRDEPDRGRYEHNQELVLAPLFDELCALAAQVAERPLRLEHARWLRLRHRDYQLTKGDVRDRPVAAPHVEVTLDLSAVATGQAEIVYTDGHESWVVTQQPGAVAIVAREPWLYRYERYLNLAVADTVLHRLRLSLSYLDQPEENPPPAR